MNTHKPHKPVIGLLQGDIAGIGPELLMKILNKKDVCERANIVIIGAIEAYYRGVQTTGIDFPVTQIASPKEIDFSDNSDQNTCYHYNLDLEGIADVPFSQTTSVAGQSSLQALKIGMDLYQQKIVQSLCFMPLNKESMHKAGNPYNDEMGFCRHHLDYTGVVSEFNVVDGIWNGRVTSHVSLREVPDLITFERVSDAIRLAHDTLKRAGYDNPRIAVSGLNPHSGDGGLMGMEEIEVIIPAIQASKEKGINVKGPYPGDTVYLQARAGEFDTVVTMYHDQGQVAIKMMGFDRGVSVMGGLPLPITTPAHGTAFDIAGKNQANEIPTYNAFMMSVAMGERS